MLIEETYFGWAPYTHADACPNPTWDEVQARRDEGRRPGATTDQPHTCTNGICLHANCFGRVRVRLLCRDCDTVYTIAGEGLTETRSTTELTGWGQRPRQVGDVWLWPGDVALPGSQPYQYLVTRQPQTITPETVYGIVTWHLGSEIGPLWIAGAVPDEGGAHQISHLRWRHTSRGLVTVDDAAAWIAGADTRVQRPLVVTA
ncbi:hypothetical protein JHN63_02110 [Streptomyces sp. MBT65]|uniref:hypothetical protein n=1 Tax=Streptomyces sp. MBT65 TaxID=1488395 RepID=UPI00190CC852|nr:hypothetical protein [Streptomyces sp. MBT65]MBK3572636.1 hypothetical protein [Streptomyces sp. MBT65]